MAKPIATIALFPLMLLVLAALLFANPVVNWNIHATKHTEAEAIRKCLDTKGPYQVWKNKAGDFYRLCEFEPGRWGVQIAKWAEDLHQWIEKTTFSPRDGTWKAVMDWLRLYATRYTGPLQ